MRFANESPTVIMMVGLQGSGKTTSSAKLAKWLVKQGRTPLLVSVDIYRPAAREQLAVLARETKIPIWIGEPGENRPSELVKGAKIEASRAGRDTILVDTAGRLHIDEELMVELDALKAQLNPTEILFVADAMTGQDAVKSAEQFHQRLGITGVVLTKMDGDARGGAALSIRTVTGQPLKFVGLGEKPDAFEPFHPDRAAQRILGMGDMMSLIEKVSEAVDQKQAEKMQQKLLDDEFTLEDFRDQLKQIRKLGPLENLLKMMPGMANMPKEMKNAKVDEKELTRIVAIIDSMTQGERNNPLLLNGGRRKRIAMGSGSTVQDVNNLVKQYQEMRKMMKKLTGGLAGGMLGKRMSKMKLPFPTSFPGFGR